jgi:NADPH:quinone reductase-like Zn-dependent oxidoreductase
VKRWQADIFGEPLDVLKQVEAPLPEPEPTEARVRVLAASVALPDLMMVRGTYPLVQTPPASPGQEVVGIVDQPGSDFPFAVGTKIVGNSRSDIGVGGFAEFTRVPEAGAMLVPYELTDEQAVGFPGSFYVAHIGLHHRAQMLPGETLLVLGGAGRTGSAAIQLGKAMGSNVIATARDVDKASFCTSMGADHVIDLSRQRLTETALDLTGGRGVDVIYDTVGGSTYTEATNAIASPGGRVLIVGFASGTMAEPDARDILFRDYSVSGALSAFRSDSERNGTADALSAMLRDGRIKPPVTATYPFDAVPAAIEARRRDASGQTVVTVSSIANST